MRKIKCWWDVDSDSAMLSIPAEIIEKHVNDSGIMKIDSKVVFMLNIIQELAEDYITDDLIQSVIWAMYDSEDDSAGDDSYCPENHGWRHPTEEEMEVE